MPDDGYIIPLPPLPELTEKRPHPRTFWISVAALVVALIAATFSGWQAYEAHRARIEAKTVLDGQAKDVERSRKAAEDSAKAAVTLADVAQKSLPLTERGANASEGSARTAEESLKTNIATFKFEQRPILSLIEYKAVKSADGRHIDFTVTVNNVGKTEAYEVKRQLEVYCDHTRVASALPQERDMGFAAGPNTHLIYTVPVDLTAEQAEAVTKDSAALKVVLNLHFQDAFKDPYKTIWCLQYDPLQVDHWSPCTFE